MCQSSSLVVIWQPRPHGLSSSRPGRETLGTRLGFLRHLERSEDPENEADLLEQGMGG